MRGKDDHFVRAVFEVPPGRGYVVGDIKIAGQPIEFGAQIADFITIKLEGLATRIGQSTVAPFQGCRGAASRRRRRGAPPVGIVALPDLPLRSRSDADVPARRRGGPAGPRGRSAADAEEVGEQELIARLPEGAAPGARGRGDGRRCRSAGPAALSQAARGSSSRPRLVSGKIMAYASPDSTYAVTKKLLDSAQRSIVIGIYDFRADYMKEHLKKAMRRGRDGVADAGHQRGGRNRHSSTS